MIAATVSNYVFSFCSAILSGHSWSNTAFLADIGWQGLYFDPVKEHVLMTEARHWENNVTVFETAVGNQTGEIVLDVVSILNRPPCQNGHKHDKRASYSWLCACLLTRIKLQLP